MRLLKRKSFSNGCVFGLELVDGFPIEITDTFLPYYTKDAVGKKQNMLTSYDLGSRDERWMVGVSCMSGCPVGCKFCATGQLPKFRNLTFLEIIEQVQFVLDLHPENYIDLSKEFKINYTRMGEPFLNIRNVRKAIEVLNQYNNKIHHYISTIGIKDSDFSWIKDNITLQISLHSLNEERRAELIPFKNLMSLEELGQIRTKSNQKTTLNLTLVDEKDFDINVLNKYFDPDFFFIKLSPINPCKTSEENNLGKGIIKGINLI